MKRGMWWLGSATVLTRLLDVGATLIVLALLTREQLGTAALVLSAGAVVESVSGVGLGHALIQAPNLTRSEEHSLFWLTSGIGLLLGGVMLAISPLVASAYAVPALVPMVAVTGVKLWLVGTAVVPQQLLSKHLRFREAGAVQTFSTAGEGLLKVGLAVAGFGAWALVLANVFRGVVLLTSAIAISRFVPRLHFRWREVSGYLKFGVRVAASGLLYQCYKNADYFLVGKILGVEVLGIYRAAFDLAMQPLEMVLNVVNRVAYPVYAKIASDTAALRTALLRSTRSLTLICAPLVAFLFFAAGDLLAVITHERWGAAEPAVQLLVWGGLLRGAAHLFPQMYVAVGKPIYAVIDSGASLVLLVTAFYCGLTFLPEMGVLSVCWAWILVYPLLLELHLVLTRRIMPMTTLDYLRALAPAVGGVAVMVLGMAVTIPLDLHETGPLLSLSIWAAVGLGVYAAYVRLVLRVRLADLAPKRQVRTPDLVQPARADED